MARPRSHLRKFDFLVAATAIVGGLAIVAALLGYSLGSSGGESADRREAVAAMPTLMSVPVGDIGWIEGKLLGLAPPDTRGLVIFVRERYVRRGRELESQSTPAFELVLDDGARVRILNQDYTIDRTLSTWAATSREEEPAGIITGALDITGIANGDRILVIGRRNESGVIAQSVAGFDRATYLERLDKESQRLTSARWWLWGTSLALGLLTVVLVRRVRRSLRKMSPAEDRRRREMDVV
jgi:hypothetical protein